MTPLQPDRPSRLSVLPVKRKYPLWRILLWTPLLFFALKGLVGMYYADHGYREGHAHHLKAAIRDCRIALRLGAGSAATHNNLGFYLYESGQYAEAEKECREALRIRPNYSNAHDSLAQVLSHTGRYDESVAECQEAIRLKPSAISYNSLGYALYQRGQKAQARQQWKSVEMMGNLEAANDARRLLSQYP